MILKSEPGEKKTKKKKNEYCTFYYVLLGPCPAPLRHRSLSQLHPRLYTSLPVFRLYSLLWILSFLSLSIPLLSLSLRWITAGFSIVTCCWWQSN